jgi:hypothetical protein
MMVDIRKQWENLEDYQKLVHVYEWCNNLTSSLEKLRAQVQALEARVAAAEAAAKAKGETA